VTNKYKRGDILECKATVAVSVNRKVPEGNYLVVFTPNDSIWGKDCYYLLVLTGRHWLSRCRYADRNYIENAGDWEKIGRIEIDGNTPIKSLRNLVENFPELKEYINKKNR
jgi:hypothetical protein